jgi:hypothetical protein
MFHTQQNASSMKFWDEFMMQLFVHPSVYGETNSNYKLSRDLVILCIICFSIFQLRCIYKVLLQRFCIITTFLISNIWKSFSHFPRHVYDFHTQLHMSRFSASLDIAIISKVEYILNDVTMIFYVIPQTNLHVSLRSIATHFRILHCSIWLHPRKFARSQCWY